ncbi:MAG: SIMPL domain-containing protein [Halobacteriales archaeon]|nr:SIMPL domain-containing protein [Halobacteriales archaeon]
MEFKHAVLPLALVILLVTAGCAETVGEPRTAGGAASADGSQTIAVGATGQVSADPNQAILRVAVVTTGGDAPTARQRLAENVSRMREALAAMGIGEDQIRTSFYDLDRDRRPPREGGEEQLQYRATHAFEITLDDTETVGQAIDTAVENGATRIDGVEFTLSESTRRELRNQALTDAMANARTQANTLARTGNLTVTGVAEIRTADASVVSFRTEAFAADAGGTAIDSGPVTVRATVQVVFNATRR